MVILFITFLITKPSQPKQTSWDAKRGVYFNSRDYFSSSGITSDSFKLIKSWGMDHVRLNIHWNFIEKSAGVYDENNLRLVDKYVTWADETGLNVIIGGSKSNDEEGTDTDITWYDFFHNSVVQERYYEFCKLLVNRYATRRNVIAFTPMHVPGHKYSVNNQTELDYSKNVWNTVIFPNILRKVRDISDIFIIYEPLQSRYNLYSEVIPYNDKKIVYGFIFYFPDEVTHQMKEYDGYKEAIRKEILIPGNISKKYNVPLYNGEWGIKIRNEQGVTIDPPTSSRLLWVQHVKELCEEYNITWTYYVFGYDEWSFALLNSDGTERAVVGILKK